ADKTPFDPRLDHIGAEDILLFRQLVDAGRRFVWTPDAAISEIIPPSRLDSSFLRRRRYLSGQHRCLVPLLLTPPRRAEVAAHMLKGAAAVAVAGPVALIGRAFGRWPVRATGLLMSGLGKVFWWRVGAVRLYGTGHR
ncbi:MAG: hypothetical protein AAGF45_08080, partial [Pseudomonadota bacterium]